MECLLGKRNLLAIESYKEILEMDSEWFFFDVHNIFLFFILTSIATKVVVGWVKYIVGRPQNLKKIFLLHLIFTQYFVKYKERDFFQKYVAFSHYINFLRDIINFPPHSKNRICWLLPNHIA